MAKELPKFQDKLKDLPNESNVKEFRETKATINPLEYSLGTIENQSMDSLKIENKLTLKERFNELAPKSPLYENNHSRLNWMERFEKELNDTDGFEVTKMKTLSANVDSARGSFGELARAFRIDQAGLEVKAIGKDIITELGRTDIDILANNMRGESIWIENKDVKKISLSDDFKTKIDKIANGLNEGVEDKYNNRIEINKAIFVNKGEITQNAIEYARSKGIHIKEKMDGFKFLQYIKNF